MSLGANRQIPRHVRDPFCRRANLYPWFVSPPESLRTVGTLDPSTTFTCNETTAIVDEVKLSDFGTKKDFIQPTVKSGEDKVVVDVCPQSGSRVKQKASDLILATELARGMETLLL